MPRRKRPIIGQALLFSDGIENETPTEQALLPMEIAGFESSLEIGARIKMHGKIGKIVSVEFGKEGKVITAEFGDRQERYLSDYFMASVERA